MKRLIAVVAVGASLASVAFIFNVAEAAQANAVSKDDNYGVFDWQPAKDVTDFAQKPPANALYRNPKAPIEGRVEDLLKRLTPEEKMRILHMSGGASGGDIPRIGLVNFRVYDGPNGSRCDRPITYFPSCIAYAATFDRDLVFEAAATLGRENRASHAESGMYGRVLLGPGSNIARTPMGARNFEYFGEDPVLSGETAAAYCRGLQSVRVSPCMKHYLLNDQEWCRTVIDVRCPERALREIYARPFEIAVRKADPWAIMNSYNQVEGLYASHNRRINDLLREAGWTGALYPDWGGYHGDLAAINGGTTIESGCRASDGCIRNEVKMLAEGKLDRKTVERAWRDSLRHYFRIGAFDQDGEDDKRLMAECVRKFRGPEHRAIAYRAAAESLVMLKNADGFLPIRWDCVRTICVLGPNADRVHSMIGGRELKHCGGSGAVIANREPTPLDEARIRFGRDRVFTRIEDAAKADLVVYFGGLNHSLDREVIGWGHVQPCDRTEYGLDAKQVAEITAAAKANPKIVVALTCGAPVGVDPWEASVKALFVRWYAGEQGPIVFFDALFGHVNPSGHLPYTWGVKLDDWYCHRMGGRTYPGVMLEKRRGDIIAEEYYDDGIWVGYRGFDKFGIKPKYPFGYGLSYTTFGFEKVAQKGKDTFAVRVTNTGKLDGRCVVQCYATKPKQAEAEMPEKELVAFESVTLAPGESREVAFTLGFEELKYFNEKANAWQLAKGRYRISIGPDSATRPVAYDIDL